MREDRCRTGDDAEDRGVRGLLAEEPPSLPRRRGARPHPPESNATSIWLFLITLAWRRREREDRCSVLSISVVCFSSIGTGSWSAIRVFIWFLPFTVAVPFLHLSSFSCGFGGDRPASQGCRRQTRRPGPTDTDVMRVTGPNLRRRNHAWLQMRSREREARRLARRQEEADDEDEADDEGESSEDGPGADSSDDEADDINDSEDEAGTVSRPAGVPNRGTGPMVQIGPGGAARVLPATGAQVLPENALSAEDGSGVIAEGDQIDTSEGEESADETTSPPPGATSTATESGITGSSSPQPTLSTAPLLVPTASPSSSSSLDELLTSLTGTAPAQLSTLSLSPIASTANGPSPTAPATGSAQSGDSINIPADSQADQRADESLEVSPAAQTNVNAGAAAGIVIGVLGMSHS